MLKKIIVLMLLALFFTSPGVAAELAENITYEFTGASCEMVIFKSLPTGKTLNVPVTRAQGLEKADAMVCTTKYPLMTERLASYGNLKVEKGRRVFDTSSEKLLTAAGRQLYNDLMALKVGRLLAIFQAPVAYNQINIVPLDIIEKDAALIDLIKPLIERAAKLDAASE
jgi:hypothetical protein